MGSIYHDVWRRGGIARTWELLRDGHTSHHLTAAVRRGEVVRARQGHYACPELDAQELHAVRVGGRLTGLAGARRHGIWTPTRIPLDVTVAPDARALRSPVDMSVRLSQLRRHRLRVHWTDRAAPGTRSLIGALGCVLDIARTQPAVIAFAAVESAIALGKVSNRGWARAARALPRATQLKLRTVNGLSGSGGESIAKFGFVEAGISFAQQVQITADIRVDFVLGNRLVVEIDGAEFHATRDGFEEDHRRDAVLRALGFRVLRFSYWQVSERWPEVMAAVEAAMSSGDHLA
ncbi:very-short-patch-repair endonuclease [Salinibacterium sp. CAN_S4]|uniref:endonuclease domain-containing protein n=1 Tax=Salinibacterium sp. CAN_S4 TaxID=2787727 RepID=UPI0018EFED74